MQGRLPAEPPRVAARKPALVTDSAAMGSLTRLHPGSQPGQSRMNSETAVSEAQPAHAGKWRILTALTQLGAMQLAVALGTLVRNKVMAVYLKPAGFGEFTQLMILAAPVYTVVQCGMAVGLSRNAAAAQTTAERQRRLATANFLTTALALAILLVLIPVLLSPAANGTLQALGIQPGLRQKALLAALLAIAPVEALRNNYMSFLQGVLDIKGLSAKRSAGVAAGTVVGIPLIALFGVSGACVQSAVAAALLALLLGIRCNTIGYKPLALAWDRRTAALLGSFGAASLVIGFSNSAVDALIRARLIAIAGMAENGLYQAALSLSAQVTAVVLGSVGAYSLATLSQDSDAKRLAERLDELLRVVVPVAAIGLGTVGLLAQPLFTLLFSAQFASGVKYLPLLLAANYMQVGSWAVGAPLLGCGLIRYWIAIQLASASIRYATVMLLPAAMGAYAIAAAFLIGMTFDTAVYTLVCTRRIGIRIAPRAAAAFAAGGAAVVLAALAGAFPVHPAAYAAAATVLFATTAAMAWPEAQAALEAWKRRAGRI
jgi:O-antigen/teichoic acid export membrane protein